MVWIRQAVRRWLFAIALSTMPFCTFADSQVLATVGDQAVTADDLAEALASSPFATQFTTMDENDQAALRGDMLQRLVAARLLFLEALRQGIENTEAFKQDLEHYRLGLLYRAYMDRLRSSIEIPPEEQERIRQDFAGDSDAMAAAKSLYRSERYATLRPLTLEFLKDQFHFVAHEERIASGLAPDTTLAEGDGLVVRYSDIGGPALTQADDIKQALYEQAELVLVARAAEADGIDVGAQLSAYVRERLPALLMEEKIRQWIPGDPVLRDYFDKHPQIGYVPENRHLGQLVAATRDEAEALRQRILSGESLFRLAGEHSIDPYGKEHLGDMGWIKAGTGVPALDAALDKLPDDAVSEVIETPAGFHLVIIADRRGAEQKRFEDVEDRVRQMIVAERLPAFLTELSQRFPVTWQLPIQPPKGRQPQ